MFIRTLKFFGFAICTSAQKKRLAFLQSLDMTWSMPSTKKSAKHNQRNQPPIDNIPGEDLQAPAQNSSISAMKSEMRNCRWSCSETQR